MDHYKLSQFEKVKAAETKLSHEISELKNEVEENEMLFGQNVRPSRYSFIISVETCNSIRVKLL